jgi:hypothetical protein
LANVPCNGGVQSVEPSNRLSRKIVDWEAVEREYRAGQFSLREIARQFALSDTAIRKRATASGWTRPLADKVREAVREKLVRADSSHDGSQATRASDDEIVDKAAGRGFQVQLSHRRDLAQLHGLKRVLAARLAMVLDGLAPECLCLGAKESPGDLLEKLSRIDARLIPLERQAFNLDAAGPDGEPPITLEALLMARIGKRETKND